MPISSIWTDDRIGQLKYLWGKGDSAAEIAALFGTTRNAVLGKIHRLGLSEPKIVKSIKRSRSVEKSWDKRVRPAKPKPKPPEVVITGEPGLRCVEVEPRNLTLMELERDDCRFPYGDGPFLFCGHPTFEGSSYCRPHMALASDVTKRTRAERERYRRETLVEHKLAILEAAE